MSSAQSSTVDSRWSTRDERSCSFFHRIVPSETIVDTNKQVTSYPFHTVIIYLVVHHRTWPPLNHCVRSSFDSFVRMLVRNWRGKPSEHDLTDAILQVLQNLIIHLCLQSLGEISFNVINASNWTTLFKLCSVSWTDMPPIVFNHRSSWTRGIQIKSINLILRNDGWAVTDNWSIRKTSARIAMSFRVSFFHYLYELEHLTNGLALLEYISQCLHRFL